MVNCGAFLARALELTPPDTGLGEWLEGALREQSKQSGMLKGLLEDRDG